MHPAGIAVPLPSPVRPVWETSAQVFSLVSKHASRDGLAARGINRRFCSTMGGASVAAPRERLVHAEIIGQGSASSSDVAAHLASMPDASARHWNCGAL